MTLREHVHNLSGAAVIGAAIGLIINFLLRWRGH